MEENTQKISQFDIVKHVPSNVRDFLGAVIKLNEQGIYHDVSCPFCSSKYRTEAETIFLKTPQFDQDRYNKSKEFLHSKNELLSIDVIKNHCNNHINQGESQLKKIEYLSTLDNIGSIKLSTLDEIDLVISALKERLIETSAITANSRISKAETEVLKSNIVSQISKSFSALLKLRSELMGELRQSGDVILIDRRRFKDVFNEALDNAKNDEEKNIIINLLKNLSKSEDKSSI